MFSIKKTFEPGSLRDIGSRPSGFAPHRLPVAGKSREAILSAMGCKGFTISGIAARNAFVVREGTSIYYLFVRPSYRGYKRVATLRFGDIPPQHDVDHILAKGLADNLRYGYVLVALVPERINRSHGRYERPGKALAGSEDVPDVCFADVRIFDKVLGRKSKVRRPSMNLLQGYDPRDGANFGLTLKQRGIWNITFGFDRPAPRAFVRRLKPIPTMGDISADS